MDLHAIARAVITQSGRRKLAVFLDYDGTLTPIVRHPEDAYLSDEMREAVASLSKLCELAIISGRDLDDVRARVNLPGIAYAGSHGFEIEDKHGQCFRSEKVDAFLPVLDKATALTEQQFTDIRGVHLERKRFSLAVHYRGVHASDVSVVEKVVDSIVECFPELRKTHGKKVFDLQPDFDWHKGRAVAWLLEALGLEHTEVMPLYLGDDITDEDAFEQVEQHGGIGIFVRDEERAEHQSRARWELAGVGAVNDFLNALTKSMR